MLLPSNISTNALKSPSNVEGAAAGTMLTVSANPSAIQPYQKNFALVTSLLLCNLSGNTVAVFAKIVNGTTSGRILSGLPLPANRSYDVISGNKITLKEGDTLYVWHSDSNADVLSAVLSYTLHVPLTTYDV